MYPREVTVIVTNISEVHSYVLYKKNDLNISNITLELSVRNYGDHVIISIIIIIIIT